MPNPTTRAALLSASCSLLLVTAAIAQEKASPLTLIPTTTSAEARSALIAALDEVTNIGGTRRVNSKLAAIIAADPNFGLGRAWYAAWTSNFTLAERDDQFARALQDASANHATTAELLFIAAMRESRAGRNAIARDLFDVVRKLVPDDPHVAWSRLLVAANNEEARRLGEAGIKRFPDYAPIYNILAYRLNTDGQTEAALRMVERYVALAPTHPNPEDSHAEILQLNNLLDDADAHYVKALEKDPQFDEALVGRAEIAVMRGDFAAARPYLKQALVMAATPERRQLLGRNLAATYLYEGKFKEAKAAVKSVIDDADKDMLATLLDKRTLALLAALQGDRSEAVRQYSAGKPETAGRLLPLSDAMFHAVLNRPDEVAAAVTAMEANVASSPDDADAQQAMQAARVIGLVMKQDLKSARAAQRQITDVGYKALSAAFVVRAARIAGDPTLARAARVDVDAYMDLSLNSAFARLIAQRK
jgi:tetratricopeptide (TPR) repeat protein